MEENKIIEWTPASMLEVTLNEPDDFLKVRETLTRIGVASRKDQKLYKSCHILISKVDTLSSTSKNCFCLMAKNLT